MGDVFTKIKSLTVLATKRNYEIQFLCLNNEPLRIVVIQNVIARQKKKKNTGRTKILYCLLQKAISKPLKSYSNH